MKRTILASIIGIATALAATSVHAAGFIVLDNYTTGGPYITYGPGSGGPIGAGITGSQWTIGVYDALGSVTVASDPTGMADPSTLGPLSLQTGANSTTKIITPGGFSATGAFSIGGYSSGLVTMEVVVFDGATYAASTERAHSSAFTMTPATGNNTPPLIGLAMPGFSVTVPEPSLLALSGIGAAALMLFRRRVASK